MQRRRICRCACRRSRPAHRSSASACRRAVGFQAYRPARRAGCDSPKPPTRRRTGFGPVRLASGHDLRILDQRPWNLRGEDAPHRAPAPASVSESRATAWSWRVWWRPMQWIGTRRMRTSSRASGAAARGCRSATRASRRWSKKDGGGASRTSIAKCRPSCASAFEEPRPPPALACPSATNSHGK